jgi:hypothetical protein
MFYWYKSNGDGTADRFEDSVAICARIDAGESGWFANPEGAILHGGVVATAFKRTTAKTYDAVRWLETGEMIETGEMVTREITAAPTTPFERRRVWREKGIL